MQRIQHFFTRPRILGSLSSPETFFYETVKLDRHGSVAQKISGTGTQVVEILPGGIPVELVEIRSGYFQMGSRNEKGYDDEQPVHPVMVDPFFLGKYPITQAQWNAVMGHPTMCRFHGPDLPAEGISWKDATRFCQILTKMTGRNYGLPSEAQWEYACRAGTTSPFSFGDTITTEFVNYVGEHTFREEPPGIYRHSTTPVGSFFPNPWGLYDMHGNVWEFCADTWYPDYCGAPVNGHPRTTGKKPGIHETVFHPARGGSWHEIPAHCRSAIRLKVADDDRLEYYGMRIMLSAAR